MGLVNGNAMENTMTAHVSTYSNDRGGRFNSNDKNGENSSTNNLETKCFVANFSTFLCYSIREVKGEVSVMK